MPVRASSQSPKLRHHHGRRDELLPKPLFDHWCPWRKAESLAIAEESAVDRFPRAIAELVTQFGAICLALRAQFLQSLGYSDEAMQMSKFR